MDASGVVYLSAFNASAGFVGHMFFEISQGLADQLTAISQKQCTLDPIVAHQQIDQGDNCASFSRPGCHHQQELPPTSFDRFGNALNGLDLVGSIND